jgi:hypothetical protein
MHIHNNVAHLQNPLHTEFIRAHNSGRHRDKRVCTEMLARLSSIGKLKETDPTFVMVTEQAKQLLHEIWEKRPPTLGADFESTSGSDDE